MNLRFLSKFEYLESHYRIDSETGCWVWTGYTNKDGYGTAVHKGKKSQAHRFVYELYVGPIPTDTLDHLCRNHSCVNPSHLEPVSRGENVLRGDTLSARKKAQTHCIRGHSLEDAFRTVDKNGRIHRFCRECNRLKLKQYYKTGSTKGAFGET